MSNIDRRTSVLNTFRGRKWEYIRDRGLQLYDVWCLYQLIINPVSDRVTLQNEYWLLYPRGWRQSFFYANIDIELLCNNYSGRTAAVTASLINILQFQVNLLLDVGGGKNCSCFITRIMNRERATDFSSYFLLQL